MKSPSLGPRPSRRRVLSVIAAAAGAMLWPRPAGSGGTRRFEWTGAALGTQARIVLHHQERAAARDAVRACRAEIARLEREFSLYRADSALSRLNRDGRLEAPSHDLRHLLAECQGFGEVTGGAFDVSVQPLWRLMATHFAAHPDATGGPPPGALAMARSRIDYRRIEVGPARVTVGPGMTLTLNGIAQGYITDRIADVLRARGWTNVLIDLGEIRALDSRRGGGPWIVGLDQSSHRLTLDNCAVATSSGKATRFEASGRCHHLLDPRTGASPNAYRSVSVVAPTATIADALSTALYLLPRSEAAGVLRAGGGSEAWLIEADGRVEQILA